MKKIPLLVPVSMAAMIAIFAHADTETIDGIEWTYTVSNGEVSLGGGHPNNTAIPQTTPGVVNIPSSLGGCPVTSIGECAFFRCKDITSVTIPDSVTSIDYWALAGCSFTEVCIPKSVTNIAYGAFSEDAYIVSFFVDESNPAYKSQDGLLLSKDGTILVHGVNGDVIVPDTVTTIAEEAFYVRIGLTSIEIPKAVTNIGTSAFCYCSGLEEVTIPDSVTEIGILAFANCESLTSVTIPDSVTSIGWGAFDSCSGLASVTIPDSVTSIGQSAFYGCSGLTSVTIPDSVTSIGDRAFYSCSGLTSVTIPDSVTSIGQFAFSSCSGLMDVTIPDGVTSIGSSAFSRCSGLTSVTIPDSVTSIGESAFDGTPFYNNLPDGLVLLGKVAYKMKGTCPASVEIPDGIVSIGDSAFLGCNGLTSVAIPDSVTSIGNYAFLSCRGLTSVTIPDGVMSIGRWAFEDCTGLTNVTMRGDAPNVGRQAFDYIGEGAVVHLPRGSSGYDVDADGKWQGITVEWYGPEFTIDANGVLTKVNLHGATEVVIPNSVTSIGNSAFYYCSGLTSVTIPDSVTSIGKYAFSGCSGLTNISVGVDNPAYKVVGGLLLSKDGSMLIQGVNGDVIIPDSVTSIGYYAFEGCSGLTSVIIPHSVTNIGGLAFFGCSGLTSVTIPDSVTSIGYDAFRSCSGLTGVKIGDGVTHIGECAFEGCSGLTSVYISDLAAWCNISFEHYSNPLYYAKNLYLDWERITELTIPDSVTSIGEYAFSGCSGLTSIAIPDSVTSIGKYAFSGCSGLTSIAIPDSVTSIGKYAFSGCSGLTSVIIPHSVTNIGDCAFYECYGLTSVTIPDSVTSIGSLAFGLCNGIKSVTFRGNAPSFVADSAFFKFYSASGCIVRVPLGSSGWEVDSSGNWQGMTVEYYEIKPIVTFHPNGGAVVKASREVDEGDSIGELPIPTRKGYEFLGWYVGEARIDATYVVAGDITAVAQWKKLSPAFTIVDGVLTAVELNGATEIVVPDGVMRIGSQAFKGSADLTSVVIPEGVMQIGKQAFMGCAKLTSVAIPEGVTIIGERAFEGCASLDDVSIPSTVTQIGRQVFMGCAKLTSVVIPEGVTSIGESAFEGCASLDDVSIPSTVTRFGHNSFANCPAYEQVLYRMVFGGGSSSGSANEVSLTVTNVVVHYVTQSVPSAAVTPDTASTGIVNVIAEVSAGKPVAMSSEWAEQYPAFAAKFGNDFTAAITKPTGKKDGAGNDMYVWQDFVAGTDPTDENDKFTASITFDEDGKPIIAYSPELTPAEAAKRKYTTYGKAKLNDKEWTHVAEGEEENYNFFKVTVEMR